MCDALQTPAVELGERFSEFNGRYEVFPNQMESVPVMPERADSPVVVGWGGSSGHYEDVLEVAPALAEWVTRVEGVRLALMGDRFIYDLFSGVPEGKKFYVPPGSLQDYFNFLESIHIGIIPLKEDNFNLCRSDVKFIEYASRGVAPVCSDVRTYNRVVKHESNGLLFGNPKELIGILDCLLEKPEIMKRTMRNAYRYVLENRIEEDHAGRRADFYSSLLKREPDGKNPAADWIQGLPGAVTLPESRHCFLTLTEGELFLYRGMTKQFRESRPDEAVKFYKEAARVFPDFHFPHYCMSVALKETSPDEALKKCRKALSLERDSCSAAHMMTLLYAAKGETDRALREAERCVERFPFFPPGWVLRASLLEGAGRMEEGIDVCRGALEEEAYNFPAACSLISLLMKAGREVEAGEVFQSCFRRYGRIPPALVLLGTVMLIHGRLEEASECFLAAAGNFPVSVETVDLIVRTSTVYRRRGEEGKALEFLERAVEQAPGSVELNYRTARLKEKSGDREGAIRLWERILAMPWASDYHPLAGNRLAFLRRDGGGS
ncbi:MAG: tetratricopeptide repeat protein [bacterium]